LVAAICTLVKDLSRQVSVNTDILAKLGVDNVFLLDSTSITLPKSAKENFPAPRSNVISAAIK
jgi:hypothetical protein